MVFKIGQQDVLTQSMSIKQVTQRPRHSWRFLKVAVGELPNTQRQCSDKCPVVVMLVAAFQTYLPQCETVSQAASLVPVHFVTTKGRQYSLIVKTVAFSQMNIGLNSVCDP